MAKILYLLLLANILATCSMQLITPMMACNMECLREKNVTSTLYDSVEAKECREYCHQHAYDFLHQLG